MSTWALAQVPVQIFHNAGDPMAATIDIGVRDLTISPMAIQFTIGDVAYRSAVNFQFQANKPYQFVVFDQLGNTRGVSQPTYFEADQRHLLVINGVIDLEKFDLSVNGNQIAINFVKVSNRNYSIARNTVELQAVHGAADVGPIDAVNRQLGRVVVPNLSYGQARTGLVSLPEPVILDLKPAGSDQIAMSYEADLRALGGQRVTLIASGFGHPERNQNGAAFEVLALLEGSEYPMVLGPPSIAACHMPVNLRIADRTPNSVTFEWTSVAWASMYRLTYREVNESEATVLYVNGPRHTISTSEPNKTYRILVNAFCQDGNISNPTPVFEGSTLPVDCNIQTRQYVTGSSCEGCVDGSLVLSTWGATPPYMYSLDGFNYQEGNTFVGLPAGDYAVLIKDANGCVRSFDFMIETTLCSAPTNIRTSVVTGNRAQLDWEPVLGANSYTVRYWAEGDMTPMVRTRTMPSIVLSFLRPGTNYMVEISSSCGGQASRSRMFNFRTNNFRDALTNVSMDGAFSVYPNPTSGQATLNCSVQAGVPLQWEVLDVTGKSLHTATIVPTETGEVQLPIDLGQIPAGLYLLQCSQGDAFYQTKLVRE